MPAPRFLPRDLIAPRQIAVLAVFSVLKALGLALAAYGVGRWIADMAAGTAAEPALLWIALAGALARTAGVWGLNTGARRMGLGAKERLRATLVDTAARRPELLADDLPGQDVPVTATLASHGIEKLDDYFTKFIPALIGAAVVPLLLGLYILSLDWISAVVLILTVPLIPVFMALIGMHTQETLNASQAKLEALARQLYELAQGLPALLGLGRARSHGNAIAQVSERYRVATMKNLKTVFLSSFWLELLSTLSVAVLAVMIGVRLVGGNMDLAAGLIVLILAPEIFGALREVGSAYHAADDGLNAYQNYRDITEERDTHPVRSLVAVDGRNVLEVRDLSVSYDAPVHQHLNLSLAPGERQVLRTASGTGKTTLLGLIAEAYTSDNGFDAQRVTGQIYLGADIAVIRQHPRFNAATGTAQLQQDVPGADDEQVARLAAELDLQQMLPRALGEYSPGELRRLEVLRAVLRIHTEPGCRLLLADEPTAHLDARNAATVRTLLDELPTDCAVLIASHDTLLAGTANQTRRSRGTQSPYTATVPENPEHSPLTGTETARHRFRPLRELFRGYRSAKKAAIYGAVGTSCAVALAALSGWLIVESSYQPAILHLTIAFVMVRTLGIGRAVFRYLEQLAIHDAVLGYAGALREKMWNSMVADPARWGLVSRSSVVLRFLLAEVDELRDLLARVLFPPIQAIFVWVAGAAVLYLLQPQFGLAALLAGLLLAFPGRWLVRRVEGTHLARQLTHRLELNQRVLGMLNTKGTLRAFGALGRVLAQLTAAEAQNTAAARRHALSQGVAPALGALTSTVLAVACAALSTVSASFTALAVLLALALGDSAANALAAVQHGRALRELSDGLAGRGVGPDAAATPATPNAEVSGAAPVAGFDLQQVDLAYAGGEAVVHQLNARIEPGAWTAVTGPSGSGKSTLLTALLGALPVASGNLVPLDAQGRPVIDADRATVAWCPQEAHLFDSSLRRNLLLGVETDVDDATLERILHQVALGDWYERQPEGLDTRIGSGGHNLSGGQRCKLAVARALVGNHSTILLDEPTAHLGEDEGAELMATLHTALAGRTVVLITHDQALAEQCGEQIVLGAVTERVR